MPGCFSHGDTQEEAIGNIQEAVELYYVGEDASETPEILNSDLYIRDSFCSVLILILRVCPTFYISII